MPLSQNNWDYNTMDGKISLTEQRAKSLNSLRQMSNQATAMQIKMVDFLDEINRENLRLRTAYVRLVQRIEMLENVQGMRV